MKTRTIAMVILAAALPLTLIDTWADRSDQPLAVGVRVDQYERLSKNEAHFRVSVTNNSARPVFSTGIVFKSGARLYPLYLEWERLPQDWLTVAPCVDTPPPEIIKLEPGVTMMQELALKVPLDGVCKERNIQFEGKFRFRLDYFETEAQARLYLKRFLSKEGDRPTAAFARSEPLEIPAYSPH